MVEKGYQRRMAFTLVIWGTEGYVADMNDEAMHLYH